MTKKTTVKVLNIADSPLSNQAISARTNHYNIRAKAAATGSTVAQAEIDTVQDYIANPAPPDLTVAGYKNIIKPIVEDYWQNAPNGFVNDLLRKLFDTQRLVYSNAAGVSKGYYTNRYWPRADGSYMEKPINEITYKVADSSNRFTLIYSFRRNYIGWGEFVVPSREFSAQMLFTDTSLDRSICLRADKILLKIDSTTDTNDAHAKLFKTLLHDLMQAINVDPNNDLITFFKQRRAQAALYDVYL
jgi:hypothetical protein